MCVCVCFIYTIIVVVVNDSRETGCFTKNCVNRILRYNSFTCDELVMK